jgi:hypothetical protein
MKHPNQLGVLGALLLALCLIGYASGHIGLRIEACIHNPQVEQKAAFHQQALQFLRDSEQ